MPLVVLVWPTWIVLRKAGYPGALALLALIPLVNVVALFVFAFSDWPLERYARKFAPDRSAR